MEEMRRIAQETVMRACGFASLAIFCVMIGLSFMPREAFQAGGFLSLLLTLVLNPWVQTKKSEYGQELKSRSESALIAPGLFNTPAVCRTSSSHPG